MHFCIVEQSHSRIVLNRMSFAIQGTREALLVLHLHIIIIIIRKQIQIPLNCDIFRQIIISIRILLHCNQIFLGTDCDCLRCINGFGCCAHMQIRRATGTCQSKRHQKSCHFFIKITSVFHTVLHIWPDSVKNREHLCFVQGVPRFLYNSHFISAKNSRSILFGRYFGVESAAIPQTSESPYFFAICKARNT